MNNFRITYFFVALIGMLYFLGSCGVNSNIMFKTPKGEEITGDSIPMFPTEDYKISIDDKITFQLYANDGEIILQNSIAGGQNAVRTGINEYLVRRNGYAELPIIGDILIAGMTVHQTEDTLEKLYAKDYNNPFVQVKITNKRVVVFPGNGSDAKVILLENNNTTLMEAIAAAGGITDRGKAKSIKLMRREGGERKVYLIDLSTIEGLPYADMVVQANDYIYVEPNPQIAREIVKETAPVISIISSVFVVITLINRVK